MFAKLPQRFTAPFELGDGAKLAFRSQPGGVSKLATTRVRKVKVFRDVDSDKIHRTYLRRTHIGTK